MPRSRLTITPAEFERWLAGNIPDPGDVATTGPRAPLLVAPPPPPVLVAPPPPPPKLGPVQATAPAPKAAAPPAILTTIPGAPELGPTAPAVTPAPAPIPPAPVAALEPAPRPPAPELGPTAPADTPATVQTPPAPAPPPANVADTPAPGLAAPAVVATPTTPAAPSLAPPPPPPPIAKTPPERQVATLPPDSRDTPALREPGKPPLDPGTFRISFSAEATDLSVDARARLDEIAARLKSWPEVRVQLVGYARELEDATGQARRRSLFRVISVRKYLVGQGVLSTRMDVRALGDNTEIEPRDRVDVIIPPS